MRRIPDALLDRPFTLSEGIAAGLTSTVLQGRRFRHLLHEVYVVADVPVTHDLRCAAARLAVPTGVISHASATLTLGLPLALGEPQPGRPYVTVPTELPVPQISGLVIHTLRLPAEHVVSVAGLPVTCAARTFLDRAGRLSLEDLVAMGDLAVRRGLATVDDLRALAIWARGRRGVVRAREATNLIDPAARNPLETRLRLVLVLGGLPSPECNAPVFDEAGQWLAEADLLYRRYKLILEFDGRVHLDNRQRVADLRRRNLLTAAGYTVLSYSADDVLRRPDHVLASVTSALRAAGCRLPVAI